MSSSYAKPLYKKIFNEDFFYGDFKKRMKMQKCIYLAEQFGLNVGDYEFTWYKHGPYSQRLQDEVYSDNRKPSSELMYSDYALSVIKKIKYMIEKSHSEGFEYSEEQWLECLASVHYLNRMYRGNKQKTVEELMKRKPHLNNVSLNQQAYSLVVPEAEK